MHQVVDEAKQPPAHEVDFLDFLLSGVRLFTSSINNCTQLELLEAHQLTWRSMTFLTSWAFFAAQKAPPHPGAVWAGPLDIC
jgi:hypothetical protein